MRYIGRIITNMKMEDVSGFIEITQDASSVVDKQAKIPTLIIGYKKVTEIFGETSILDKKIGENLYWTFTKRERRIDYEDDIQDFYNKVEKFATVYAKYEFFDLLSTSGDDKKALTEEILGDEHKVLYETEKILYLYLPKEKKTIGLSTDELKFLGKTVDGVKRGYKIKTSVPETFLDDDVFKKNLSIIPFLYYLGSF